MNASIYLYKNFTHHDRGSDKDFENSKTKAFTNSTQIKQDTSQSDSKERSTYNKSHRDFKRSLGSRSTTNQEIPFQDDSGSYDLTQEFSGNFKNSTGAVLSIERSHDRESSRGLFEDATRLRHTRREGGNMKEQIFGYRPDPYHRSHRKNSDDERQQAGSNDQASNARNSKSYRRNYATVSSTSQIQGLRDQFLQDLPPRRIARETYNIMSDTLPAVNEKGFPDEQRTQRMLQGFVNGQQERTAAADMIKACFQQLMSGVEEDNCEFAVKLATCIQLDFTTLGMQET
ncbi:uncharacterized protein [Anabrus simplex]|uniref:uncharacterized protein isoform X2 n=1 Tax=Anabrus simplex TaxID=316456 RepID=UPI0035A2C3E5